MKKNPGWQPKPPKKGRKKRTPRQILQDDLDTLVSLIIRDRDKKCVQCGSRERLTNGHVFPGRYLSHRWDIRPDGNCHTQCWPHNYKHIEHQSEYYEWFINKFGLERFKELKREYYAPPRYWGTPELRDLYITLKQKYGHLLKR